MGHCEDENHQNQCHLSQPQYLQGSNTHYAKDKEECRLTCQPIIEEFVKLLETNFIREMQYS